jgi:excinuclease UvrABC nuclease subunit
LIPVSSHPERSEGSNTVKIHAAKQSDFITLRPSSNDFGFRLIQAIRDEAHRFAKKYHTYLRKQSALK